MKKIRTFLTALVLTIVGAFAVMPIATVGAQSAFDAACTGNNESTAVCKEGKSAENSNTNNFVNDIVNTLLFIIGALSVVMIIVGGIMYVVSGGNSSTVTMAKNTLLYAIVGFVVSLLAYAIVNWVVKLF